MSDDEHLVFDLREYLPHLAQQLPEAIGGHGAAALEHSLLVRVVQHHAQAIRHHHRLQVARQSNLFAEAHHRRRQFQQIFRRFEAFLGHKQLLLRVLGARLAPR